MITTNINGSNWFKVKWSGIEVVDWAYRTNPYDHRLSSATQVITQQTVRGWLGKMP